MTRMAQHGPSSGHTELPRVTPPGAGKMSGAFNGEMRIGRAMLDLTNHPRRGRPIWVVGAAPYIGFHEQIMPHLR
jgi:hypothetical protein